MARHNYGMSISHEKCKDIAETSWLEENDLTSKSPVLQSGAPVYYTDTVSLPIEKQYKLTCLDASGNGGIISPKPFIVPHNETSPPPPSHGSPAVCSQYTRNQISSSVPSSLGPPEIWVSLAHNKESPHGPPDELHQSPPPYSPPISQVELFILKLRKFKHCYTR